MPTTFGASNIRSIERGSEKGMRRGSTKSKRKKKVDAKIDKQNGEIMKEGGKLWCNIRPENTVESRLRSNTENKQSNVCIAGIEEKPKNIWEQITKQNYDRGTVVMGVYYKNHWWCIEK